MLFDMKCKRCGAVFEDKYFKRREDVFIFNCNICGSLCVRLLNSVNVNMDSTCAGWDPILEVDLRGNTHRKQVMKEQGLVERDVNAKGEKRRWV